MATAPDPATISTAWRSGSRKDTVARMKSSSPASSTNPTGKTALSCQLTRTELNPTSSTCDEPADIVGALPPGPPGERRAAAVVASVSASGPVAVSYTHLRAHETRHDLVCRLLL